MSDTLTNYISIGVVLVAFFVLGFFVWAFVVWVLSWAFGFEFMWRYAIGAWFATIVLKNIFWGK